MPFWIALSGARLRLIAATLGVAFAGCLGASTPALAGAPVLDPQELAACQQINAYRASNGLGALKLSPTLTRAARWMSGDMAANDYLSHIDSRGRLPIARVRTFGFRSATAGENVAAGYGDAAATFKQWKASAAHRRVMLDANFTQIGIGRATAADSMFGWFWTTTFGGGRGRAAAC